MNSKEIKKYSLLSKILEQGQSIEQIIDGITELAAIDFQCAFEAWEYALTARQSELADPNKSAQLEGKCFEMFNSVSESKTRQLFIDSLPLNKLVYTACASSCTGTNLQFIAGLILSTKIDSAEEALRCVRANNCENVDFGERMRVILDTVFATYCAKNNVKKVELTRKQSNLLLDYISKIKGANKNLLTQRIKEL